MTITVTRTIHPIGQGAFYTEQFTDQHKNKLLTVVIMDARLLDNDTEFFCSHGLHSRFHHPSVETLKDFKNHDKLLYGANDNPSTKITKKYKI